MSTRETRSTSQSAPDAGPFLAKIVSHLDPKYMGGLEVELLRPAGNYDSREGQLHQVQYLSPFYGVTSVAFNGKNETYNETQKSYGMWMIPPDIGSVVMVIFVQGDPRKGFWIGCVQDEYMNMQVPGGAPATEFHVDKGRKEKLPVAEFNKDTNPAEFTDPTKIKKPVHIFVERLETQGLLKDEIRGTTTTSARREVPSAVFGISTPGPVDKRAGATKGKIGKFEHKVNNAFVSRLGGTTFVMDDGDDKLLRKKPAHEAPPEYANVESGETDGQADLLHNELFRIRTRTGHQILFHNTEDLIYIGNARGTTWIELTSDGKIDIFAEDSVSVRTKQDLNFYADRDINIEAGRNINIKANNQMHTHVIEDSILVVDGNQKIHVKQNVDKTYEQNYQHHVKANVDKLYDQNYKQTNLGNFDLNTGGHNWFTAGGPTDILSGGNHTETAPQIHMNGPQAATADTSAEAELPQRLKLHKLPDETGEEWTETIMRRVPTHEPYPHHENLDPKKYKPEETDRDKEERFESTDSEETSDQSSFTETLLELPELWNKDLTQDTFRKQ